jgi:predicted hydrocarbon binding protein
MLSAFLKRLLFARQFFIINGKIEVLGVKQMMLSSDLLLDLQNINQKKVYSIFKENMLDNIKFYGKKLGTATGMLKNIADIYEILGAGSLEIADLSESKKRGIVRVHNSPIAEAYLRKNKRSKEPVCISIAGVLAGMFTFLFKKDVNCVEKVCLSQGKDFCEFVIKG